MVDTSAFKHLYPFKSHFLNIHGHQMHYIDEGQGEILVMLHGNPTWSFYYRNLIRHFSKNYRVIAPDHMGMGLSDKPRFYQYTLKTHIENLNALLTDLNVQKTTLLMHDWGGPIGMGYAHQHPENVKRFIVFNSAAFMGGEYNLTIPIRIELCRIPVLGEVGVRLLNGFVRGALWMGIKNKAALTSDVRKGYLAPYNSYRNRIAILKFVRDIPWHEKIPSYPIFENMTDRHPIFKDHPMLIVWGEKDFCFTHRYLMAWEDFFPNAWVKIIADAGHLVVEDAYDRIIPWIEDFLNRYPL
ncbi:MAG: alpha/beta hydrolase [Deltaproteobacteria bacterium RIFCSPHIGHO2_02_FULL_40_11]|nr:MAG: alpha/beta hydrolase [Deltaproteobacteria bacterium RIFCSPHIGHO2_02_FULL_40_11]